MDVLDHREWMRLREQFQQLNPPRCKRPEHIEVSDPECHGYGPEWSWARYCVQMRAWGLMK